METPCAVCQSPGFLSHCGKKECEHALTQTGTTSLILGGAKINTECLSACTGVIPYPGQLLTLNPKFFPLSLKVGVSFK